MPSKPELYPCVHIIFTLLNAIRRGVERKNIWREFRRQKIALKPRLAFWLALCKEAGLVDDYEGQLKVSRHGQGLFTSNVNGVGIRSMKAPGTAYDDPVLGKDPQPAHMKDYVRTIEDNGGVHINSGIPNHAFYVTALKLGGYAWEKAGHIWYKTLTDKFQERATFQQGCDLTFEAAGELYGANSLEQKAVKKGWDAAGITVGGDAPSGCLSTILNVFRFGKVHTEK